MPIFLLAYLSIYQDLCIYQDLENDLSFPPSFFLSVCLAFLIHLFIQEFLLFVPAGLVLMILSHREKPAFHPLLLFRVGKPICVFETTFALIFATQHSPQPSFRAAFKVLQAIRGSFGFDSKRQPRNLPLSLW